MIKLVVPSERSCHKNTSKKKALCLMVRKLCAKLKFSKYRSKVTVKVMYSKFMVPSERSCHKKNTCQIYKSPISYGKKVVHGVKVFQMQVKGQGHVIKIHGTIGKVLSYGTHLPNMKALSLKVKKL